MEEESTIFATNITEKPKQPYVRKIKNQAEIFNMHNCKG